MEVKEWLSKCFYRVSIKAVIFNTQGKVLVVREKNNPNWNLPGGGMDYGETEYEALQRELHEEVGFTGGFAYTPLGIWPKFLDHFQAWQLWVVYRVEPENLHFTVGEESDEFAFIDPEEFKESKPQIYRFAMKGKLMTSARALAESDPESAGSTVSR